MKNNFPSKPPRHLADEQALQSLPRLLTVSEAAALLRVSERTVRRLVTVAGLPVVRIGRAVRFRPDDLEVLMKAR